MKIFRLLTTSILLLMPFLTYAQGGISQMNSWVESQVAAEGTSISSYFFLFIGGFLASLLPCTYPLYPITANIISARSGATKNTVHPIIYYSGLAFIYLVFGIIASISGGAFNQILRLPLTNIIIGIIIFLMGLTAAGLLYISFFSGAHSDTEKKGLPGTFILGMGAGLIASSCVGPVVVSILIGIASQNTSGFSFNAAFVSATKMLSFGLGLGIPFLLIGAFGVKLPKAGKWMSYVQYALAAFIIYFAYTYLEKGLLGYGFSENEIHLLVVGAGVFLTAAYFFQTEVLSTERMKKSLISLSAIIGVFIMLRGMLAANTIYASNGAQLNANASPVANTNIEQEGGLTWYLDKEQAYKAAQASGKKVFIDFYADWCTNCKEFKKNTEEDKELQAVLNDAVLLKIYDYDPEFEDFRKDTRFPELKVGLPFFVVTDKDGNLLYKTNDYLKTDEMALFLTD
jgi:thioredoxin:protein disulfide reductase